MYIMYCSYYIVYWTQEIYVILSKKNEGNLSGSSDSGIPFVL